jgi:hypothetical protein
MKKVLVAIYARQVSTNMLDFACYIAKLTHSKLTGIFLDNKKALAGAANEFAYESQTITAEAKEPLVKESVRLFTEACNNRGANCSVRHEEGMPDIDIIKESRFAELIIVDPEMSFREQKEDIPSGFIKELLSRSECPVILSPFSFYGIDEIVFAYDGSAASVFAIKQFIYLFPELTGKKLTVLQVNEHDNDKMIEKDKIGELLQMHFSSIGFQLLYGKAGDELLGYLLGKKNRIVVMGAFGRSMLSDFFKHSTAELIIKTINLPVFIAHHK